MDLKIIEKKEQPMLSRIEITGKLEFKGPTPSAAEVKKQLSAELKVGEDLIVVKNIFTHFGTETADLVAYSYLNKEDMEKIEPKPKEKPKAKPKAEKPEAPKKEKPEAKEAPKEEKAEAPKKAPKETPKEAPKEAKK